MSGAALLAVGIGGALGCWLRWALGTAWNATLPSLPLGTLAANLVGGYLIGIAVAFFGAHASLAPEWRLFCITGFLGGLTPFSTFSAENVQLMLAGRYAEAGLHAAVHLAGSLLLTAAGIASYRSLP